MVLPFLNIAVLQEGCGPQDNQVGRQETLSRPRLVFTLTPKAFGKPLINSNNFPPSWETYVVHV